MWMMPLHLHVNQKSDYDDMMEIVHFSTHNMLGKPGDKSEILFRGVVLALSHRSNCISPLNFDQIFCVILEIVLPNVSKKNRSIDVN